MGRHYCRDPAPLQIGLCFGTPKGELWIDFHPGSGPRIFPGHPRRPSSFRSLPFPISFRATALSHRLRGWQRRIPLCRTAPQRISESEILGHAQ